MKAIVMIIFAIFCLPFEIIHGIVALFKKKKPQIPDKKARVDNAIKRELMNSIKRRLSTLLIFMPLLVQAQIETHGSLEFGCRNSNIGINMDTKNLGFYEYDNTLYADINLIFSWKFIEVQQALSNNFEIKNAVKYKPIDIDYKTRISLKYKKFSFGYEHSCIHPVVNDHKDLEKVYLRGGSDKIFIKIAW